MDTSNIQTWMKHTMVPVVHAVKYLYRFFEIINNEMGQQMLIYKVNRKTHHHFVAGLSMKNFPIVTRIFGR